MDLPPFLLDHWLAKYQFASPPIAFDLAASTGPKWTVGELLSLGTETSRLDDVTVSYAPAEGSSALREEIGEFLGVDPDWVVVTTGASEALSVLLCLAARPGGNVVLPSPAFPAFEAMANVWGLGARHYNMAREGNYRQSARDVLAAADGETVLALVNTPHNPTGAIMSPDETGTLAAALAERRVPLIVDEVYHPLYFGARPPSAASMSNVLVIGDMSKALSLAGLRMGWIVDADPERRKKIIDARSYFTISSSPVLEALATHALRYRETLLARLQAVAEENLAALSEHMERVADILAWVKPAGGTVAFPWFRDGRDSRPFCEALAAKGVLVAPGDCFAMPDHMRVGFAVLKGDQFAEALSILEGTLREHLRE
ncbi:pyridoxal phosphate-dependent aminotransferase [Mesorhizobium sp. AaZ16]|uniref:pyridoxal phosphate-dependent aminotransferase n=1 Tax=Mesorhizobium sp. AaZ16 TaxID=3402289 RepID=UPI00374F53AC